MRGESANVAKRAEEYQSPVAGGVLAARGRTGATARTNRHGDDAAPRLWRLAALLIPGAFALGIDSYQLGRPSLWRDEAYTVDAAHRSVAQIVVLLWHTDAVNGAYYIVMHPVIALLGTSEVALRLPSVLAMAVAATMTAAIGRRIALAADLPAPSVTGLLAGLFLAAAPEATRYAQNARSYAIVTMLAAVATYLLLRALERQGRRWWAGYGVAIALMGLFNLLSLLLVVAHAVTVLVLRTRSPVLRPSHPGLGRRSGEPGRDGARAGAGLPLMGGPLRVRGWLVATVLALAALSPVAAIGVVQRGQINWLKAPGSRVVHHLIDSFAGSRTLLPLVATLVVAALVTSLVARRPGWLAVAAVTLPWLALPAMILILVSQIHPVFDPRYVAYCLPALSLLMAAGLAGLARVAGILIRPGAGHTQVISELAWLPALALLAVFAVLVVGPQRGQRLPGSRPDNLRRAAAILAAHERPGDGIIYLPDNKRVASMAYPAPYQRLRDVALARSPVAAGNLLGTEVPVPVLRQRFAGLTRVWVVTDRSQRMFTAPRPGRERSQVALLQPFHLVRRWSAGRVWLSLFVRG